jgi:replication-associated recombination protein RarA
MFGNDELKKVIPTLRLDRPILVEGSYGSGKTSIAYIIAKMFGANEYNILERDCENLSKVDNMREELENLTKTTIFGRKKVLILDEIHGLSDKSLKVLLKPLENEALLKDVLIIGCTTEVSSISKILLSRFMILRVRPLSVKESKDLLDYVCSKEGIILEKWKKQLLVEKAEGIPRLLLKNLSLLKTINDIDEAKYLLELSIIDEVDEDTLTLYKVILTKDWGTVKPVLISILKKKSPSTIKAGLLNLTAGRLTSEYFKDSEGGKLLLLTNILQNTILIPEKAGLIISLYRFVNLNHNLK